MNIEEKKADFMRRFKASRERKAEYLAQMEKRMRDDYRRRTGKEAESFCRDRSVIGKHVRTIFNEGELQKESVWAKFAYTASDGKTYFLSEKGFCPL